MEKILDKVFESIVALNKQTNKHMLCKNIQRLEVQFTRTSNFYCKEWVGGCL